MKNYKDIFKILTKTDFKLRYQGSVLGIIWVILKPLLLFLILYLVFSLLFGQKDPNYKLNLLLGIIFINYFQEGTTIGLNSLLARANVLLKVNFSREIVLYAALANASISLFFNLIIFTIFWFITPTPIHIWSIPIFFGYLLLLAAFIMAISFFTSILFIKFRDLSSIWEVVCSLAFYATPVIYPLALIPERYHRIMFLNPLTLIIHNTREVIVRGAYPDWQTSLLAALAIIMLFGLGLWFFRSKIKKVAEDF